MSILANDRIGIQLHRSDLFLAVRQERDLSHSVVTCSKIL